MKVPKPDTDDLVKARSLSYKQLYDFFNICLNKSFLKKRVLAAEVDVNDAHIKVTTLQDWRLDIETRIAKRN